MLQRLYATIRYLHLLVTLPTPHPQRLLVFFFLLSFNYAVHEKSEDSITQKLSKKSKKLKEARTKILYLERKANLIKGIGLDELDLRDLENLIVDFEATLTLAKQVKKSHT